MMKYNMTLHGRQIEPDFYHNLVYKFRNTFSNTDSKKNNSKKKKKKKKKSVQNRLEQVTTAKILKPNFTIT